MQVAGRGPNTYAVNLDGTEAAIRLESLGPYERRLHLGSRTSRIVSAVQGDEHLVEVDGAPHRFRRDDQGVVRSPTPGVVVAVPVGVGDEVAAGVPVAVVESMKMETAVAAPFAGRVRRLLTGPNEQVDTGSALVQLDATGPDPDAAHPAARLAVPKTDDDTDVRGRCRHDLAVLRGLMLGYDIETVRAQATTADLAAAWPTLDRDPELAESEDDVLVAFADLRVLYRSVRDEADADVQVRAPQEHLHAYLRSLNVEGEGLPASFLAALRRALGHYGVEDLERTPELEEALYWIHQSQQRVATQIPVVVGVLERWLEQGPQGDTTDDGRRRTLDALVAATQRRHPVVADLAREVRFGIVDEPLLRAARDAMYAEMEEHLAALVADPAGLERSDHIKALVDCPQPLAPLLLRRMAVDPPETHPSHSRR